VYTILQSGVWVKRALTGCSGRSAGRSFVSIQKREH
jgi:hypothetical protein